MKSKHLTFTLPEPYIQKQEEGILMISISGIRAKFPDGITLAMLLEILEAFCKITGKKIVIGNDGRISSPFLEQYAKSILMFYGKHIFEIGIAPTPTIKASCVFTKADAGIIITASHNPQEWNGIKFLKKGGIFFDKKDYQKLFSSLKKEKFPRKSLELYQISQYDGIHAHIESILKHIPNINEIQKQKYKVVIDPVNSSGVYALPLLLESFNCEVISIHNEPLKKFQRNPEPTPMFLKKFSRTLKRSHSAIGFALDPDGDRLVCGSPTRGAINEEYTLGLAYLGKKQLLTRKSRFVINYSTSNILEKISKMDHHKVIRAPVGEANVLKRMLETKSVFGGEGNGGIMDPSIPSKGRDSLTGIAYILSAMAHYKAKTIDDLLIKMPSLFMEKMKVPISWDKKNKVLETLYFSFTNNYEKEIKEINQEDGYFFSFFDNSWIHVRSSNTEPVLRIIYEMNSPEELKTIKLLITNVLKTI